MRISDWSSDVCSSDLCNWLRPDGDCDRDRRRGAETTRHDSDRWSHRGDDPDAAGAAGDRQGRAGFELAAENLQAETGISRPDGSSDERRVGERVFGTGRYRWWTLP